MAYTNFMDAFRGEHGNFGKQSWLQASQHYNPQQIKVALQQQAKYNNASLGWRLREQHMQGVAGMGNPDTGYVNPGNPLGMYQGQHGNLGLGQYNKVKAAGFNLADIPDLARQSGMFLPEGAHNQWLEDMGMLHQEEKLEEETWTPAGSDVGTSAMGVKTKTDPKAGKKGSTQDLKRKPLQINKSINV